MKRASTEEREVNGLVLGSSAMPALLHLLTANPRACITGPPLFALLFFFYFVFTKIFYQYA